MGPLAIAIQLVVYYYLAKFLYRLSLLHPLHAFPGPRVFRISGVPMLLHSARGTQHIALRDLHNKYGPIVRIGPNTLSFRSLPAIRRIYSSSHAFDKSAAYDFHSIPGNGVFFVKEKGPHSASRRIYNRAFSQDAMAEYFVPMSLTVENLIRHLLEKTTSNGQVDLTAVIPRYCYDTINATFFGGNAFEQKSLVDSGDPEDIVSHGSFYFKAFELANLTGHIFSSILQSIPGYSRIMKFEGIARRAARRRLELGASFKDGVSRWIENDEGHPVMDVKDLPLESATVLLGGADTVASPCILLVYFLILNPHWHKRLRAELDGILSQNAAHEFTMDTNQILSLNACVILNAVIHEGLRLSSPFPVFTRVVPPEGASIDGVFVPGGTTVGVPVWAHHINERYFPSPELFDPTRWIEGGEFKAGDTFFEFAAGPFNCAGSKFALIQLRMFLAKLVTELEFTPSQTFDARRFWNGIRNCRSTTFLEPLIVKVVRRDERRMEGQSEARI